jgi:uncharacterized protein (TIGR03118 family)
MDVSAFFRKKRAGPARQRGYRPVLECLENRHLLSGGYGLVNLASDVPGLAGVTDRNLVNPWGMAYSPTGPFWFAENGRGVSDIVDGRGEPFALVVTVPSAARSVGAPTGTVFNGGAGFVISEHGVSAPSRFLFASEDGTISGWTPVVDPTRALVAVDDSSNGAVYTGLAVAAGPAGHSLLYAADFSRGTIDVFDQNFRPIVRPGSFRDPSLPDGFAPFNIQKINGLLFVTYAQQAEDRSMDLAGAGHGFIDVYDTAGNLVRRFASQGALNSPWGLALAAADFAPFSTALLVGNNGDGTINAYDPRSGNFLGQLGDDSGAPIAIPGLWALSFGNGHAGGDSDTLFFTAGADQEKHGLFGALQAPEKRGADTAGTAMFDPHAPGEPGDYPLPPRDGPAFRAGSEDRFIPIAELLPMRGSSLVLVPTLSANSPWTTKSDTPVRAGPIAGVSSGASGFAGDSATGTIVLIPVDDGSQPAGGAHNDAVALDRFLDLGVSPNAVGRGSARSVDVTAGAQGLLLDVDAQRPETQSREEQQLPGVGHDPVETRDEAAWINTMILLVGVSFPMIWTFWVSQHIWFRQPPRELA